MTGEFDILRSAGGTLGRRGFTAMARIAFFFLFSAAASAAASEPVITVRGTILTVTMPDGKVLEGAALTGGVIKFDIGGNPVKTRIASVTPDPKDPTGEILLYDLRAIGADGAETPFCMPDAEGKRLGFPLSGRRNATGALEPAESFEFVCTGGAQAKCVRFGYKPWARTTGGQSMLDHYNACVRMVRADYCGDGVGHTRTGTTIDIADRIGINKPSGDPAFRFEAFWNADGATCVAHPRISELLSLEDLVARCPRLAGKTGPEACKPDSRQGLLYNFSR